MDETRSSTLSGFYRKSLAERQAIAREWGGLDEADRQSLIDSGLPLSQADLMIENVIGRYSLPFAIATNFQINGRDHLIPMVIEEPSVVAACSHAAKLFRAGGGFVTSSDEPIMIGQIQLLDVPEIGSAIARLKARKSDILAAANERAGSILARGGGAIDLELRPLNDTSVGDMLILHLLFDTRDAMGANAINSALEYAAP